MFGLILFSHNLKVDPLFQEFHTFVVYSSDNSFTKVDLSEEENEKKDIKTSQVQYRKCGVPNFAEISTKLLSDPSSISPCCHTYVEEVLDNMWEEYLPLLLQSKKFSEKSKKEISHEVSVACMKTAMTNNEIKIALAEKLSHFL